jgi:hypothetical protein
MTRTTRTIRTPTTPLVHALAVNAPAVAVAGKIVETAKAEVPDLFVKGTSMAQVAAGPVRRSHVGAFLERHENIYAWSATSRVMSRQLWSMVALLTSENGKELGTLTGAQRVALATLSQRTLQQPAQSASAVLARSASAALLEALLRRPGTKLEEGSKAAWRTSLLEATLAEKNPGLRAHLVARLGARGATTHLLAGAPAALRRRAEEARDAGMHLSFGGPDAPWRQRQPPVLKVMASVQDEFFRSELASYRAQGYDVREVKAGVYVAEREFPATKKQLGGRMQVTIHQRDHGVMDPVAQRDVDVVYYSGHANLGGIGKTSMAHGPKQVSGDKLIAFFSCRGGQERDELQRRYPGQQLLLAREGTYPDDDRAVMHQLFGSIMRGESHRDAEKQARPRISEKDSYFWPDENAAIARDNTDLLYIPRHHDGGESRSMKPAQHCPPLQGAVVQSAVGKARDAVAWVNTIHNYWADEEGNRADRAINDRFHLGDFFAGDANDPITRVRFRTDADGKQSVVVDINASYAHQDRDALTMMVTFDAMQQVFAHTRPNEPVSEHRLRAMAMAAESTHYLVEYGDVAETLLRQFARRFDFPTSLSRRLVALSVSADNVGDCTAKCVDVYRRGLAHGVLEVNESNRDAAFRAQLMKAMDALQKNPHPVARVTYDAIAMGLVKVDSLDDMTRHDYLQLRKEMKGALDANGYQTLSDKRSSAYRAVTTAIDGYMWDDRIYVVPNLSVKDMVTTLVHEVNHVLNKSEENYQTPKAILQEEYRAFLASALVNSGHDRLALSKADSRALKEDVIANYELKGVTAADVPDVPPGILSSLRT